MKETLVHNIQELVEHLRKYPASKSVPTFRLIFNGDIPSSKEPWNDGRLEIDLDGRIVSLAVDCKLNPTARHLDNLASRAAPAQLPRLLVTVRLTDALVERCKSLKINCLDLNGRVWLRTRGLLIDRNETGRQERFRLATPPVDFFSKKSSRLARVLLSYRDRSWKQSDLAEQTGLSQGLLSRLLTHASDQGWVTGEGSRANWRLVEPDSLLDAWETVDRWEERTVIRQFSTLESNFGKMALSLLAQPVGEIAFTQWFAANLRFPCTEPPVLSVYLRSFPDDQILTGLRLREVSAGGNIWLIIPVEPGVFQAQRRVQGLPMVSDVQIYLDLIHAGLRGPEQARELRKWEGFCR